MTTPTVEKDLEKATLAVTTEFDAPIDHVWRLWSDPRKLEKWWGPPTHPATMVEHDLTPGARVFYYMTDPEGQRYHGLWRVLSVDAPHRLEVEDTFADADGNADPNLPATAMRVSLEEVEGGTRMVVTSKYASSEAMQQVLAMGVEEGLLQAISQIDSVLTEIAAA